MLASTARGGRKETVVVMGYGRCRRQHRSYRHRSLNVAERQEAYASPQRLSLTRRVSRRRPDGWSVGPPAVRDDSSDLCSVEYLLSSRLLAPRSFFPAFRRQKKRKNGFGIDSLEDVREPHSGVDFSEMLTQQTGIRGSHCFALPGNRRLPKSTTRKVGSDLKMFYAVACLPRICLAIRMG